MKAATERELQTFLAGLRQTYRVRVPVRLQDGTRALGRLDDGPLALRGGALSAKITNVFFPQMQHMLLLRPDDDAGSARLTGIDGSHRSDKPFLVAGFTGQETDCVAFIDRFFAEGFRDDLYFQTRQDAVMVAVSGRAGPRGAVLPVATGNCDLDFIYDGEQYLIVPHSEIGKRLADAVEVEPSAPDDVLAKTLKQLQDESDTLRHTDAALLDRASRLIMQGKVPDSFWQEIADLCIACTACNLACPTCTCFDVFDRRTGPGHAERWRIWDGCQLAGFAREAGGHNPLADERARTRRRIHHRLAADVTRWGHVTCFSCGRCDAACPSNIGMESVCRQILERFETP